MIRILFLAAVSVLIGVPSFAGTPRWQASDYGSYDHTSFAKSPLAVQRIDTDHIDYPLLNAAIFFETNRQRVANGRQPFRHSKALEKAAFDHSRDMVTHKFISHTSVVDGKQTMVQRLQITGIRKATIGENIALFSAMEYKAGTPVYTPDQNDGYFSYTPNGPPIRNRTYVGAARTVVDNWMNSPGHRKNILNAQFFYLGAGAVIFHKKDFYGMPYFKATQNFASIPGP